MMQKAASSCPLMLPIGFRNQLVLLLLQCLFSHVLLSVAANPLGNPLFTTDADMGIDTYDSIVEIGKHPVNVRAHLRFLCPQDHPSSTPGGKQQPGGSSMHLSNTDSSSSSQQDVINVEGFVSTYVLTQQPPPWSKSQPHYAPWQVQQHLNISISSRGHTTPLSWVGPKEWGLWRLRGELHGPGPFQLHVAGSAAVWDLPQPLCPQQQHPGTPNLAGGLWNVLTTTSNSTLDADALAFLVLQHNTYHRSMGFSGTILRSNLHESKQLVLLPDVRRAVEGEGLIIWPWEHEHVATTSTHYWQRPKNQLTLLAAYGRDAMLSFFDFDEYLVLPNGAKVIDARCFGKPLLDRSNRTGSWTFIRFQAKTCPKSDADFPCWRKGQTATSTDDIKLLHDVCPMATLHGKNVLMADRVDSVSVHFTHSDKYFGNRLLNMTCGHLLHFYSLLEGRRAGVTGILRKLPPITWNFDPATGRRELKWPKGLAPFEYETCVANSAARVNVVHAYNKYKAQHAKARVGGRKQSRKAHPKHGAHARPA